MDRYICIHGHFYQPPRENPWLEEIEFQDSAYPYHDWNEKITAECYAPNAASRILDTDGRIIDIVNIYSKISFDFGPTLLSWMQRHKPEVYLSILEADRLSRERFSGHGSAIAHAYNHMILPLANRRDKYTQIIWGIKDFQKRFQRDPEGMWLPEAAVDRETLEILVNNGIKFTVLSPRQAKCLRHLGETKNWHDVSGERIDPSRAYTCILPSGRSIGLFFYDGPTSQEVSFGGLLNNGEFFANRLLSNFNCGRKWPQLVHIATDGETFGHHHRFGDMALSYALHYISSNNLARITNYGEFLEKHPPTHAVDIFENSSWSCVHGVERWTNNCGCNSGMHSNWTQTWRRPLRDALDWLRDQLITIYQEEAAAYLKNPWDSRNDYIDVIFDRSHANIKGFLESHSVKTLSREEQIRVLKLFEMQRNAMLMYTSCGWFFDEVSGIETIQIIQYASRALQYAEELKGEFLESAFLKYLEKAPSNIFNNAAEPYDRYVRSAKTDLLRVAAHYSISSIFEEYPEDINIYCYNAKSEIYKRAEAGKLTMVTGKASLLSSITWDEIIIAFAVVHLGDHNINAGIKDFAGDNDFHIIETEIKSFFEKGDIPGVVRLLDKHFKGNIYSLWHLFKDEQRKILNEILQLTYEGVEASYRQIYENNYPIMNYYYSLQNQLPRPLLSAAEYTLNTDLKKTFNHETDVEKLGRIIEEIKRWSINVDATTVGFIASAWVISVMENLHEHPEEIRLFRLVKDTLEALTPLGLQLNLWKAQNLYFSIRKNHFTGMKKKAETGDTFSAHWVEAFSKLGNYLHVKI
jgi:alpha-amylase/alpha-mannosidase (GH57 family)